MFTRQKLSEMKQEAVDHYNNCFDNILYLKAIQAMIDRYGWIGEEEKLTIEYGIMLSDAALALSGDPTRLVCTDIAMAITPLKEVSTFLSQFYRG